MTEITSTSKLPTDKVTAAGVGGLISIVIVGIAKMFGVELDELVVSSAVALIMLAAAYAKTERNPVKTTVTTINDNP